MSVFSWAKLCIYAVDNLILEDYWNYKDYKIISMLMVHANFPGSCRRIFHITTFQVPSCEALEKVESAAVLSDFLEGRENDGITTVRKSPSYQEDRERSKGSWCGTKIKGGKTFYLGLSRRNPSFWNMLHGRSCDAFCCMLIFWKHIWALFLESGLFRCRLLYFLEWKSSRVLNHRCHIFHKIKELKSLIKTVP